MLSEGPRKKGGGLDSRSLLRALLAALILSGALAVATPAGAFKLFGFRFFESENEDADIVDPLHYTVTFEVAGGDKDLTGGLRDASAMVADQERPVSGSLGLLAKARSERELLIAELYRRARYDGVVNITIAGKPLDQLPPDAEFGAGPVPVSISVEPGSVFTLGNVALKGDAANLSPVSFGLVRGGDAGSDSILRAEGLIVRTLKEEGRPLAKVTGREIVADHATTTLDVTMTVKAGPIAGYGETTVKGTEAMDRDFTGYMAGLKRGKIYSPTDIEDARQRLLNLQVFNSVAVTEADTLDVNGQIPIDVAVSERKRRYFGIGASYSTTDGLGLEGYWGNRNLFGHAEKLLFTGSISRIGESSDYSQLDYNASIMFEKPGVLGPPSKFFTTLAAVSEHPDAYDRQAVGGEIGISYDLTKKQTVSASAKVEYSEISNAFGVIGTNDYLIVSTPLQYVYDNRDSKLDPKKGWRALVFSEPSYDTINGTSWLKLRGEGSIYQALDANGKYVAALRVATGSILGVGNVVDIPPDRRFYAGGGGSVRGYAYQGVGPKDARGQPTGGLSYAEASVEMRIGVTDTIGIVPFVDAGTVSQQNYLESADVKFGAGLGLRYLTPFGPLRLDAAVPLNPDPGDPDFAIYAGIGQAF
jgi:translocation and assembly module TamA